MEKVFIDTDIALDLLSERLPHYAHAAQLFTQSDKGKLLIYVSSLSFSNLNYLLSRQYSQKDARRILNKFKVLVNVLGVDDKIIGLSLNSEFKDFEDAIQYYTAIENNIGTLITRNLKDYKYAQIAIITAEDFLLSSWLKVKFLFDCLAGLTGKTLMLTPKVLVASTGIEPVSGASETLILSIVLRGLFQSWVDSH